MRSCDRYPAPASNPFGGTGFAGNNNSIGNDFRLDLSPNQGRKPSFVLENTAQKLGADLFARKALQQAAKHDAENRGENDSSVQQSDHEEAPHAADPPRETPVMDTYYNTVGTGKMASSGNGARSLGHSLSPISADPAASSMAKQADPPPTDADSEHWKEQAWSTVVRKPGANAEISIL